MLVGVLLALAASQPDPAVPDVDEFAFSLTRHTLERYVADLPGLKKRGVLRVLTRNNSVSYYVARGAERGFEFELASAFAEALGLRVTFVVPERRGQLIGALLAGEGDIVAAGMSVTPARSEKLEFTRPYLKSQRVVATRDGLVPAPHDPRDLLDLTIHLSFRSTTFQDAKALSAELGAPLRLVDVEDGVEMERMMERVADGTYEATIVDDVLLGLEQAAGLPLAAGPGIGQPRDKAWAVHPAAPRLARAANRFLDRQRRLVAILRGRYFRPSRTARSARSEVYRADRSGRISPYDRLFRRVGERVGIDWRLLAAVAYTESRFDPVAKSRFGARGLMQLLPTTAARVGATRLFDPAENVEAGGKYLRRLMKVFAGDGVDREEQIRFAVAAYNCGLGHVMDARNLAKRTGRDPNRWFGQVEAAMKLKEQPEWHRTTRYGYARARETIAYVARVQSQYEVFTRHVTLDGEPIE